MHRANTTTVNRSGAISHLVMDITGLEHRPGLVLPVPKRQTLLDSALAIACIHSHQRPREEWFRPGILMQAAAIFFAVTTC